MLTLRIGNLYSKLNFSKSPQDAQLLEVFYQKFAVVQKDKVWVKSHWGNKRGFDSVTRVFTKAGKFPTGLLPEVTAELRRRKRQFERIEERPKGGKLPDLDPIQEDIFHDTHTPRTLFNHQLEAANLAVTEQRGVIKCATGGGKTLIFTAILKSLRKKYKTVILMRNRSLIEQTFKVLIENGVTDVGCVTGDDLDFGHTVTLCTAQSIHKIKDFIPEVEVLIIDEVHQWTSKMSIDIMKSFTNAVMRLGFSATPWKEEDDMHNMTIKSWMGLQLCDITVEFLKGKNVLSQCQCFFYPVRVPQNVKGSFYQAETNCIALNGAFHDQVAELIDSIPEGRIMVLVSRLAHGDELHARLPESYWIRGEDTLETREYVLGELYASQQKKVVAIVSSIGYVGINVACHVLINACGGKSPLMLIQKIGRGLRLAKDKKELAYYDFMFTGNKYLEAHSKERIRVLSREGHEMMLEENPYEDDPLSPTFQSEFE